MQPGLLLRLETGGLAAVRTVNGFAVDPENPKVMYVAMRHGLIKNADAGETWKPVRKALKNLAAMAVNSKRPREVCASATDGVIFKSTDGGTRWKR